jgi:hypothetical protein
MPQICAPAPEVPSTMFPIAAKNASCCTIDLTWDSPTPTVSESFNPGQELQSYNISYAINNGDFTNSFLVDATLNAYTIASLEHATTYTFKIVALNAQGYGGVSVTDEFSAATTLGEPDAPNKPTINSITRTSLTVNWEAPYDHASPITDYIVRVVQSAGLQWERFTSVTSTDLSSALTFQVDLSTTTTILRESFETPSNFANDYSQRFSGYFVPKQDGGKYLYFFYHKLRREIKSYLLHPQPTSFRLHVRELASCT